jgi:type IV fimbrial biogenesis protein FimT
MVLLGVIAIAFGLGVPLFSGIAANNRMLVAANDLVTSLHSARSEAVKRAAVVTLCATPDGAGACIGNGNLGSGWTVFVDPDADGVIDPGEAILQRYPGFSAELRNRVSRDAVEIQFAELGGMPLLEPLTQLAIQICDPRGDVDTGRGVAAGRLIVVSAIGRPQLVRDRATLQSADNPLGGC